MEAPRARPASGIPPSKKTKTAEIRHRVEPEGRLVPAAAAIANVSMLSGNTNNRELNKTLLMGRATSNHLCDRCPRVAIQPGVAAGGSQAPVVNSWVRMAKLSRPHLVAVDR